MPIRKIGAPPKRDPEPGERFQIGVRVTPNLKRRLDAAAEESGRSQSQEAELRLERSFDRTDLLPQVLTLAYGEDIAADLMRLGSSMKVRHHRKADPFELARAVLYAAGAVEKATSLLAGPLSDKRVREALERSLHEFLVPDWQKAGQEWRDKEDAGAKAAEAKAKENFQAEIIQLFRRRA